MFNLTCTHIMQAMQYTLMRYKKYATKLMNCFDEDETERVKERQLFAKIVAESRFEGLQTEPVRAP